MSANSQDAFCRKHQQLSRLSDLQYGRLHNLHEYPSTGTKQREEDEDDKFFKTEDDELIEASKFFTVKQVKDDGSYIRQKTEQAVVDATWRNQLPKQKGNVHN